jgi:hypothetical protein
MHLTFRGLLLTQDRRLNLFWRLLLYMLSFFVMIILTAIPGTLLVQIFHWPDGSTIINVSSAVINIPIWLGWTFFYRRKVDKRSWSGIGLMVLRRGLPQLGLGFLLGIGMVGLIFVLEYAFGWIHTNLRSKRQSEDEGNWSWISPVEEHQRAY